MTRLYIGLMCSALGVVSACYEAPGSVTDNSSINDGGGGTASTTTTGSIAGIVDLLTGTVTGGGTAQFTGNVGGTGFVPATAVFDVTGDPNNLNGDPNNTVGDPNLPAYISLTLSSDPNFCDTLVLNSSYDPNTVRVDFIIQSFDSMGNPNTIAVGPLYQVTDPPGSMGLVASALFASLDNSCNQSVAAAYEDGTFGTVTLDQLNLQNVPAAQLVGRFTLAFGAQQQFPVSGSFVASPCPGLAAISQNPSFTATCAGVP